VPWCQESQVIFFNETLFKENNIELPEDRIITWERLLEIAKEVTNVDGEKKTWGLLAPLMERFEWTLIKQNNGKVLHQDDRGRWEVRITEEAKEAISFYISLITEHKVMPADVISIDYTSLMQGYLNQKYAMVTFGCWNRRFLNQIGSDFDWGMMWIKKSGNETNASDPQALGISVFSKHKEEAFEFIKFFTSKENSANISYADWLFPVRESALEDPRFSTEENEWNYAFEWLKNAKNVKPGMPGFYTFEWKVFVPMLEKVILGDLSLDEAYEKIESDGNVLLRKLGLR
jgi:ABC-type glycerol-3-phosphate transport system substrate-binding protein